MNSTGFLYAAYIATWLIHGLYLASIVRRYSRLRRPFLTAARLVIFQHMHTPGRSFEHPLGGRPPVTACSGFVTKDDFRSALAFSGVQVS
jgi:hypothetical protein